MYQNACHSVIPSKVPNTYMWVRNTRLFGLSRKDRTPTLERSTGHRSVMASRTTIDTASFEWGSRIVQAPFHIIAFVALVCCVQSRASKKVSFEGQRGPRKGDGFDIFSFRCTFSIAALLQPRSTDYAHSERFLGTAQLVLLTTARIISRAVTHSSTSMLEDWSAYKHKIKRIEKKTPQHDFDFGKIHLLRYSLKTVSLKRKYRSKWSVKHSGTQNCYLGTWMITWTNYFLYLTRTCCSFRMKGQALQKVTRCLYLLDLSTA